MTPLYSIGYATKPIETFIEQLHAYRIDCTADVRSVPYSRTFRDYNCETLQAHLREAGIRYVWLGEELGPRSKEPAHYDASGQVQFDRLADSTLFRQGLQRLSDGLNRGYIIALMCAEKDPANCHRSLLIGHALQRQRGLELHHIGHDGSLETQSDLEHRLMTITDTIPDMLSDKEESLALAYEKHTKAVAYRRDNLP